MHRVLLPLVLLAAPAGAQDRLGDVYCDETATIHRKLEQQFGARQQGLGLHGPDAVMELWAAPGGDWTLVKTYANGRACVVALGEDWADLARPDPA